jgi:probable rRNA maturation factor
MSRAPATLKIDVLVHSEHWQDAGAAKSVVRRAVMKAAAALSTSPTELAIVLTDDSTVRTLNYSWRGVEAATNVLSFATRNAGGRHLGDIVLAYETIKREAHRARKPFAHHLAHLAVHGFLHLLGYDHESDAEARAMETAERIILRKLAVPDPYCADGRSTARQTGGKTASQEARRSPPRARKIRG